MLHTDNLTSHAAPRMVAAQSQSKQEEQLERALRPKTLQDYIGQDKAKAQLAIFIQAAKNRGEALDHTLLFGPWFGENHIGKYYRQRIGREFAPNLWACAGTRGRFSRFAHQFRAT